MKEGRNLGKKMAFFFFCLLFAATPTKWTRTALPLHAQHARACWLHIGVLVRTNGGAGRSAGVKKKTCLSLSLSLLRPGGDRPGQLLAGRARGPTGQHIGTPAACRDVKGPPASTPKKRRGEKREEIFRWEKRGKRGWPRPRASSAPHSSLFFYKVFSPAPRPAHPPTPTHPPTHPPPT